MRNFLNDMELFLAENAVLQARDEAHVGELLRELLADPDRGRGVGQRATDLLKRNIGAAAVTARTIHSSMSPGWS